MAAKKAKNQTTIQGYYCNITNPLLSPTTKGKLTSQMIIIDSAFVYIFLYFCSNAIDKDDDTVIYNNKVAKLQAL